MMSRANTQPTSGVQQKPAVHLRINGSEHVFEIERRVTLLDALREYLHLTGTKKGCDQGQFGA